MNRFLLTGLLFVGLTSLLSAQIMKATDVPEAPAQMQGGGAIVPILKVGAQTVDSLGYNFQTNAAGFGYETANANTNLNTMAYFDILFLDSREGVPLYYEVGANPDIWSVHFKMRNFTARINTGNLPDGLELVKPSWIAEVQGHGFHFGTMTQGGTEIAGGSSNDPSISLTGANEVLNIGVNPASITSVVDASNTDYLPTTAVSPNSVAFWGSAAKTSGILYAGYEAPNLGSVYVSTLAQGDVNATTNNQGWAWAVNAKATPLGQVSETQALAVQVKADAIKGFGFKNNTTTFSAGTNAVNLNQGDTGGFGVAGQVDYWLGKDFIVSPTAAFDGRLNDSAYSTRKDDFEWETGGGLILTMSPKKFVADEWNELSTVASVVANNKIQKFAYVQVMAMYSKATDEDLAIKFEEPDGAVGLDPNWGGMFEYRVNNLAKTVSTNTTTWSATGRVSYDLADHTIVPYLRWYANGSDLVTIDKTSQIKLRVGVQVSVLPGVGVEATYLSPQVYSSGTTKSDAGKFELITILSTDGGKILTPKTMNFTDWKTQ